MGPLLQVYKKYLISNAVVRPIPPKFQSGGLQTQWIISTKTLVEEITDDEDVVPVKLTYTRFIDLIKYVDIKDQSVGKLISFRLYTYMLFLFFRTLYSQFTFLNIDILAVIISALDRKQISKDGKESSVQKFVLVNEEYELLLVIVISYIDFSEFLLSLIHFSLCKPTFKLLSSPCGMLLCMMKARKFCKTCTSFLSLYAEESELAIIMVHSKYFLSS